MKEEGEEECCGNINGPQGDHSIKRGRKVEVEQRACDKHHGQNVNQVDGKDEPTKNGPNVLFEKYFQVHTFLVCWREGGWLELER